MPRVSVVMPVKNGEDTIADAVSSILNQTYRDLNLVVVNDHSTDSTVDIVEKLVEKDSRLKLLHLSDTTGIWNARNMGADYTDSEFIATMDSDDESLPPRLELQVTRLDEDKSLVLLGSHITFFGDKTGTPRMLSGKKECRMALQLFYPTSHPTTIFRRSAYLEAGKYHTDLIYAGDFEFCCRMSFLGEIANIPTPLLRYRIHSKQVTQAKKQTQTQCMWRLLTNYHKRLTGQDRISNSQMLFRLLRVAVLLGPLYARPSLRALRSCWRMINSDFEKACKV